MSVCPCACNVCAALCIYTLQLPALVVVVSTVRGIAQRRLIGSRYPPSLLTASLLHVRPCVGDLALLYAWGPRVGSVVRHLRAEVSSPSDFTPLVPHYSLFAVSGAPFGAAGGLTAPTIAELTSLDMQLLALAGFPDTSAQLVHLGSRVRDSRSSF